MCLKQLRTLTLQVVRFGGVGLTATATHVLLFALCIETVAMDPMIGNVAAFSFAFRARC